MTDTAARLGGTVHDVAVPGGTVRAETVGPAYAPALLLLHGWTLDRRLWAPQLPLVARFRLVAIDRRGFGAATAPADLGAEPADVLAVAAALGIDRFHLAGMSQGGKVALRLAADAPERVLTLTLIGAALDGLPGPAEHVPLGEMRALAAAGRIDVARHLWSRHPLTRVAPAQQPLVAAMLADYAGRDLAAPGRLDAGEAQLAGLAMPRLAMVGDQDTTARSLAAARMAAAGFALLRLPGGHFCQAEAADACNAALAAHCDTALLAAH